MRDEDAFAYFDFFGSPRVMHFLTRIGVSPNDANAHYCLDLECDIDGLRKLDDAALAERMIQEPRPISGGSRSTPPRCSIRCGISTPTVSSV